MKKKIYIVLLCMMMILSLVGCSKSQKSNDANSNTNILDTSYDEILKSAKGTTVNFYGYGGNEVMNKWFDTYVIPQMKEKYDIIGDVRGIGGMLGVEFVKDKESKEPNPEFVSKLVQIALQKGLLLENAGSFGNVY